MSDFDGDVEEMPVPPLDDRALEALLGGSMSACTDFDWLVPFVEDLGAVSGRPAPVLRPALATLLTEGFSTEKGDLPATAASNVTGPAPQAAGLPKWRKYKMTELFAGILAKLAGLGVAAKAGLGLAVAAAGVTGAGAVGMLPASVQHVVATAVDSATPFTFPDTANDHAGLGATVSTDPTGTSDGTPGVDGQVVSDAAKAQGSTGVGANAGTTGLDRANQTPAAGHVPASLPAAASETGGQGGLDTANSTPAAGHVPTSLPAAGGAKSQSSTGIDKANSTPAAGHIPANVPGRP
jgi:hypothetical protein